MSAPSGETAFHVLHRHGFPASADFLARNANEIDRDRFLVHFCGSRRCIQLPLSCIFWDLDISEGRTSGYEVEHLLEAINNFQSYHKVSEEVLGTILDYILECNLSHRMIVSIRDLICLFSLLRTKNALMVIGSMKHKNEQEFWESAFKEWMASYNVEQLPATIISLWKGTDVSTLSDDFSTSNSEEILEFIQEIDSIQQSQMALSGEDWQRIANQKEEGGESAVKGKLFASLGMCFKKWLMGADSIEEGKIQSEIMEVMMALIRDRDWRFDDIRKIFRFSTNPEHLPGLLAALVRIYEGKLESSALDELSDTLNADEIRRMKVEDAQAIPRAEVIRRIVESDFSSDVHESAQITESQLHQMMESFENSYMNGGGEFANVAKAVRAVEKYENIKMRDVQILAVLLAKVARSASVARLLQMQTGEGKTYVIVAIAISEVLDGNKVDIITSSENLAMTQCAELKKLYESVGITVAENCSLSREAKKKAKIYEADVVYGSASHFMFDALHHDFYQSNIRGDRGYSLAIVDEVDSQMLDWAAYSCRFASPASGMGNILSIQSIVWMLIYYQFCKMERKDSGWILKDINNKEIFIVDCEQLKEHFKEEILERLKKVVGLIPGIKEESKLDIPWTLWDYTSTELPLWIESAVEAMMKRKDFEYCVHEDDIVIVDSQKTGLRNKGLRWDHGLHVFLEMLHELPLQPEALCMSFISTMSYCKRYKTNLIGLTGTIGGPPSRTFLKDVYSVDFVEIPPYMYWRHIKLPHIICSNEEEWITTVVTSVVEKLNQGRACLVITQYIRFADVLYSKISEKVTSSVGTYTGSGTDIVVTEKLTPGTCIIATNLAGRGTDLKISTAVEEAGGLHVVLTSLPDNDRVERQNIGRASRTGQPGSSQMILNWEHIPLPYADELVNRFSEGETHTVLVDTLRAVRDESNLEKNRNWIQQLNFIEKADNALIEFMKLRNDCVAKFENNDEDDNELSQFQRDVRKAINFRFGMYIATLSSELNAEQVKEDFAYLADLTMENVQDCFHDYASPVFAASNVGDWNPEEEPEIFDVALKLLGRAIEIDPNFAGAAYYTRGVMSLFLYSTFEETKYIAEAIDDFEKCRAVIQRIEEHYKLILIATKQEDGTETKLKSKIQRVLTVCSAIKENIDNLIGIDADEEIKNYESILYTLQDSGYVKDEIQRNIQQLKEHQKKLEKGLLHLIAENDYEIKFDVKPIEQIMPDNIHLEDYTDEIDHFEQEGYIYFVTVEYREPRSKWTRLLVTLGDAFLRYLPKAAEFIAEKFSSQLSDAIKKSRYGKVGNILSAISHGISTAEKEDLPVMSISTGAAMTTAAEDRPMGSFDRIKSTLMGGTTIVQDDGFEKNEKQFDNINEEVKKTEIQSYHIEKDLQETDKHSEHIREKINESKDVAERVKEAKEQASIRDSSFLDHIASITENTDMSVDRFQAKYVSEVVQRPIEIEYKGSDGTTNTITYGKEFIKNSPIKLVFEAAGKEFIQSGTNTSLFDAVSNDTKINAQDLKKATANLMLNDVRRLKNEYATSRIADLLIGGVRMRGQKLSQINNSNGRQKISPFIVTRLEGNWARKQTAKRNFVVDYYRDEFDNIADSEFDNWMRDYLDRHGTMAPGGHNGDLEFESFNEKSTVFEVCHPDKYPRRAYKIYSCRENPSFMVEEKFISRNKEH